MKPDPVHPIIEAPHECWIGQFHYHVGLDGTEPYIDMDLHRDGVVRRLRFWSPNSLIIEEGFPSPTSGMEIRDISARGWERCGVQVADFEASNGKITFWARDVVDRDALDAS